MITSFDILKCASLLHDDFCCVDYVSDKPEVEYRNCARMAYYSMLHLSKKLVDDHSPDIDCSDIIGTHEMIIRKLLAINTEESNKLANDLISSRHLRVKADYYLNKKFTKQEAYKVLRKAEKAFDYIKDDKIA